MDRKGGALMPTFFPFWQGIQRLQRARNSIKRPAESLRRPVAIAFSSLWLASLVPPWANCAELRPYQLPSEKRAPYQQRYDSPAQDPASVPFDYDGFGAKAANLPLEEKAKLKQGLQERLNRALEGNNYEEVGHYAKLLEIINNIR